MVFRSATIPFDFHLSFAFELVDKSIHLLAIKVGDLALSGSSGSRLIRARERQNTKSKDQAPILQYNLSQGVWYTRQKAIRRKNTKSKELNLAS